MLKKLTTFLMGSLLIAMLAACNQTAEPTETEAEPEENQEVDKEETDSTETEKEDDNLTLEEVFDKTSEANKDLESFSLHMDIDQVTEANGEKMNITTSMETEVITEPFSTKQLMTIDMGEMGQEEMEMYLTDGSIYIFDPIEEQWLKAPGEFSEDIMQMTEVQQGLDEQLKQFREFLDDFTFEEDEDHYILTLKADGEKFNDLLLGTIKNSMPENEMFDVSALDTLDFHQVDYEIFIDKDTFYYTKMNVVMDYDLDIEGQSVNLKQDIKQIYGDHNGIDEITVPEEALEEAIEVEF